MEVLHIMSDFYTEDLSKFGYRELDMAADLLKAYANNPPDFLYDGVIPAFNMNSGYVFLVDNEYNVAMLDDDGTLYQFHSTPYNGYEGSIDDLINDYSLDDLHQDDVDYIVLYIDQANNIPDIWQEVVNND